LYFGRRRKGLSFVLLNPANKAHKCDDAYPRKDKFGESAVGKIAVGGGFAFGVRAVVFVPVDHPGGFGGAGHEFEDLRKHAGRREAGFDGVKFKVGGADRSRSVVDVVGLGVVAGYEGKGRKLADLRIRGNGGLVPGLLLNR
jgi:hypothetical protein